MLERTRELTNELKPKNIEDLLLMDAENTTLPDDSFDCVVAMYVVSVIPNPKKFIKEIKRVCKPGGPIVIINHFYRPERFSGKAIELLGPLSKVLGFRPNFSLDSFSVTTLSEEEFWTLFPQNTYQSLKKKYDPQGTFKTLYEKITQIK